MSIRFMIVFALGSACAVSSCSSASDGDGLGNGASSAHGGASGFAGSAASGGLGGTLSLDGGGGTGAGPCVNLQCQKPKCQGGATTSLSGTVYDPSGTLPLYNVIVYVPNAPLDPMPTGASCDQCGSSVSGHPVASALTDTKGQFLLKDVPAGANIPLVLQVGRWRRQITLPTVSECTDTAVTDANLTRLPRSAAEGDLPKIALSTGNADALECLLRKIGIDQSEFGAPGTAAHVNLYAGVGGTNRYAAAWNGGVGFGASTGLWSGVNVLSQYDVVILSCEGGQNPDTKSPAARQAMLDYLDIGGRVFASHWHNVWIEDGPNPLPTIAQFNHQSDLNTITAQIDQTFPKGKALAEWLVNVGGSTTLGQIVIKDAQHTVDATNPPLSQQWIYTQSPQSVQYFSANTPVGSGDAACGRLVFSDIHVSSGDKSGPALRYPSGCTTQGLSPQEKALVFMLFDLSSCVQDDGQPPAPPPVD